MNPENAEIVRYRELVERLQIEALDALHKAWAERDVLRAQVERLQVEIEIITQLLRLPESARKLVLERVTLDIIEPLVTTDSEAQK